LETTAGKPRLAKGKNGRGKLVRGHIARAKTPLPLLKEAKSRKLSNGRRRKESGDRAEPIFKKRV